MHAEEATGNEKISTDPHVTTGANDYLGERDKLFSELFETLGKSNESLSSQQDGSKNGFFSRLFRSNAVNDKERMLLPKTPTENEIEDESFVVDMRINKFWPMITALVLFGFYLSIWSLYELLIVRRILGYCLLLFIAVLTTLISYVLMRGIDPLLKDLSTVKRGKYTVLYLVSLGLTLRLAGDSTILDFTLSVAQVIFVDSI